MTYQYCNQPSTSCADKFMKATRICLPQSQHFGDKNVYMAKTHSYTLYYRLQTPKSISCMALRQCVYIYMVNSMILTAPLSVYLASMQLSIVLKENVPVLLLNLSCVEWPQSCIARPLFSFILGQKKFFPPNIKEKLVWLHKTILHQGHPTPGKLGLNQICIKFSYNIKSLLHYPNTQQYK